MDDHQQDEEQPTEDDVRSEAEGGEMTSTVEQNLDYKDSYLRAVADYDNLKKEIVRLRGEYARYAAVEVVREFLPVYDNLKKALEHAPASDGCTKWTKGIGLIADQCGKVLAAAGVQAVDEVGMPFDPTVHEALMREKRDGAVTDTVVKVVEPGYRLHDRVLRPAKVIVAE